VVASLRIDFPLWLGFVLGVIWNPLKEVSFFIFILKFCGNYSMFHFGIEITMLCTDVLFPSLVQRLLLCMSVLLFCTYHWNWKIW